MHERDASLRLFVAIYPPEAMARAMLRAIGRMDLPPHRPTPLPQVHMTLQFIGQTRLRDLPAVRQSVSRAVAGLAPFTLKPARLITLPERGRPRLVAVETDAPAPLREIQRRLATRLARHPRARPGDRFRPHITLCRFTGAAQPAPIDAPFSSDPFYVDTVMLMRSVLQPAGAQHLIVEQFPLTPATPA